jgi:D-methionine transport system substrate-binding protein
MKKLFTLILLTIIALGLASCNQIDIDDETTIYVVATAIPHAEILEQARPLLEDLGYTLDVTVVSDYATPNPAVANGSADANFFQHIPYLNQYNESAADDAQLVNVANIHIEPLGLYSKRYSTLNELPNNASVIISNSTSDHGRFLSVLEDEGLITLKDDVDRLTATLEDIETNPKNLSFEQVNPELLFSAYHNDQGDLIFINGNFALSGGLNPIEDALVLESPDDNPYVNILAVLEGRETLPKIQALIDVLTSQTIKTFIEDEYQGTVIPA